METMVIIKIESHDHLSIIFIGIKEKYSKYHPKSHFHIATYCIKMGKKMENGHIVTGGAFFLCP